jgi:acylphosphatase
VIARRAVVTGRVQGVFFRAHVQDVAEREGVSGWAANRGDGSVELHLEGDEQAVGLVLEAARSGPPRAEVADVAVRDAEAEGCSGFATR